MIDYVLIVYNLVKPLDAGNYRDRQTSSCNRARIPIQESAFALTSHILIALMTAELLRAR
jgi:hypothetical protein